MVVDWQKAVEITYTLFFFRIYEKDKSVYFRSSFSFASDIIHKYSHFKFYKKHGDKNGSENEMYAHKEEEKFLKKLQYLTPIHSRRKLLRVSSWKTNGFPNLQGVWGDRYPRSET
ncbi:hypothetical protein JJE00_06240 [Candidatus Bathyarchaeota archaeon]|nr:hypothetical protein [Candidatus Bathyarchaeota archaeon]